MTLQTINLYLPKHTSSLDIILKGYSKSHHLISSTSLHKWYLLTYFASLISAIMVLLLKCNLLVQFNATLIMLGC